MTDAREKTVKLYRYWVKCQREITARADRRPATVYGHSDVSPEDARRRGEALLDAVARLAAGNGTPWDYDTPERPIREELLRAFSPEDVITRNWYGAEVLNSSRLVFVDIDRRRPGFWRLLFRLFILQLFVPKAADDGVEDLSVVAKRAAAGGIYFPIRVYRTRAGWRLIITGSGVSGRDSARLMEVFRADPRYAALCRVQDCFRARLTPKPYRIRMGGRLRFEHPETDPETLARQREWLEAYARRSEKYAVCRYLGTLNGSAGPAADPVIRFHDERTKAFSALPLA